MSVRPTQPVPDECCQRFPRRLPPADAERVAGRVGVDPVSLGASQLTSLEQTSTKPHRLGVRRRRIGDVQVHVYLLRCAVRPVGGKVLRSQLNPDPPLTGRIDDAVERLVLEDVAVEHPGPERTLSVQISGVEDYHGSYRFHARAFYEREQ